MPYLYSAERYAASVRTINSTAEDLQRNLDSFRWMAYVMVAVDDRPATARHDAAAFLGGTYHQDFSEFVDRVAVTGNLDQVTEGLSAFVDAGARHLVLLPCTMTRAASVVPWLPELLTRLRERHVVD